MSIEDEQRYFSFDDVELLWWEKDLPELLEERYKDIPYNISVIDMDGEVNAFAGLGGNIYFTQAFLDQIEYYEELDFVLGHEIAHIENRDVLRGLISSIPVLVILSIFWWDYGVTLFEWIIGNTHSKTHETRADRHAIDFVQDFNGHVWCAINFFEKGNTTQDNLMEIFSTHPVTNLRIKRMEDYIRERWYSSEACSVFE